MPIPRFWYKVARIWLFLMVLFLSLNLTTAQADQALYTYDVRFYSSFGESYISALWKWQNEDPDGWSMGFHPEIGTSGLHILPQAGPIKNVLSLDAPDGYFSAKVELIYLPTTDGQFAGLRLYEDADNYTQVVVTKESGATWLVWKSRKNGVDQQASAPWSQLRGQVRLTRQGTTYIGEISDMSGIWKALGYTTFARPLPQIQLITGATIADDPATAAHFLNFDMWYSLPRLAYYTSESLNQTPLSLRWSWLNEERDGWSIDPNTGLKIMTPRTEGHTNVLLRPLPKGDFDVQVQMEFSPDANMQKSGIIIYAGDEDYLSLSKGYCNFLQDCEGMGSGYFFEQVRGGQPAGERFPTLPLLQNMYYRMLRVVRQGNTYSAFVSMGNWNDAWELIGVHKMDAGFAPTQVGLKSNSFFQAPSIPAWFQWFQMDSEARDGFVVFIPALFTSSGENSPGAEATPTPGGEPTLTPTVEVGPPPGW